jgi:hypothetical protein
MGILHLEDKNYGGLMMKKLLLVILVSLAFIFMTAQNVLAAAPSIVDFEIEIELKNNSKFDIEYEVKGPDKIEAKYSVPGSVTAHGKNALAMVEPLMKELELTPKTNHKKLKEMVLAIFEINENDVDDFELEAKFDNGEKIKIDN